MPEGRLPNGEYIEFGQDFGYGEGESSLTVDDHNAGVTHQRDFRRDDVRGDKALTKCGLFIPEKELTVVPGPRGWCRNCIR